MEDCIFCKVAHKEYQSEKIFYEDDDLIVVPDKFPKADIHILLIPKNHIESVVHAKPEDQQILGKMLLVAAQVAKEQGINDYQLIFNAGKFVQVHHLHLHLISGSKHPAPV